MQACLTPHISFELLVFHWIPPLGGGWGKAREIWRAPDRKNSCCCLVVFGIRFPKPKDVNLVRKITWPFQYGRCASGHRRNHGK